VAAPAVPPSARQDPRFWEERAERLLRLASPAALVQPGLLRALRRILPAWETDAATEADVYRHPDVSAADATGIVLHPGAADRLRGEFASRVAPDLKVEVKRLIERWHSRLPKELPRAETLIWHAYMRSEDPPGDLTGALAFAERLAETARRGDGDPALAAAVRHYGRTLPAAVYGKLPGLGIVWAAAFQGVDGVPVPPNLDALAQLPQFGAGGSFFRTP
jgi:hypothetical protein